MIRANRPKLAVFLPGLYGGGAEKTMLTLAGGFAERGCAVDLVLARAIGPYLASIPSDVRLVDLRARSTLGCLPALVRYLKREHPDGMVSALSRANIVAALARTFTHHPQRLVINEQNTLSKWAKGSTHWRRRITPLIARLCYYRADAIVAVSQGVADDLVQVCKIPARLVEVIYNPGATREVLRQAQLPLNHPWFAPDQPPVLVSAGRLTYQKDFGNLLQAVAMVRAKRPVRLIILGEGSDRPMLEEQIRKLKLDGDVSLPGFVDNPYVYMARAAAFVLSSRFEGLPTVLVEALTCGTSLIATDCPSGPREILRGGELGLLVPVGQTDALAEAVETTLDGNAPRPGKDSWRPYSVDAVVERYLSVLIPPHDPNDASSWTGRDPAAVATDQDPR